MRCVLWCFVDNIHQYRLFDQEPLLCEAVFCHLTETHLCICPLKYPRLTVKKKWNKLNVGHFISLYSPSPPSQPFGLMRSNGCWHEYQCWAGYFIQFLFLHMIHLCLSKQLLKRLSDTFCLDLFSEVLLAGYMCWVLTSAHWCACQ